MFLSIVLLLMIVWLVEFRIRRRRMYELASRIPGSKGELPLLGIAHRMAGNTEDIMSVLKEMSYLAIKNDGMVKAWLGPLLYFFCVDPVDLEMLLKTCLEKDDLHRFTWPVLGYGSIFAPDTGTEPFVRESDLHLAVFLVAIWRPRRKILLPAFSTRIIEGYVPIFAEESRKLAGKLAKQETGRKFKSWPFLCSFTLDTICETAMGVKINAQDNPKSPFLVELINSMQFMTERMCRLWLQPNWLYKFFPQYRQQETSIRILHGFTNDVINKRREELKAEKSPLSDPEADREFDLSDNTNKTFLDSLIHLSGNEKGYSNEELREETLMLMMAATDTTATALGYALKMMAMYPNVQDKVHQELDKLFGDSDRPFQKDDMSQLKYLERVIKETLRLFPPGPFVVRKIEEEISLPSGRVLPAGSGVVVSIWGTHRNPKYWGPNAEQFDPDRFLPERCNMKHPCAFLSFGNGPRNCIGYQYGLMLLKTALSTVLRYNRVVADAARSTVPQTREKFELMLKDVDGYEIAVERRKPLPQENA